jgi:serine/threonine-protein kinase HipA
MASSPLKSSCLVCFEPLPAASKSEYHDRCAKALFGTQRVPRLEVDPRNLHLLGIEMAGRVSLSGVQKKIALGLERGTLRVVSSTDGQFILKPQTEEYPDLPQNEQLNTLIARSIGLRTASTGLVRLSDDSLAFLSRRFDRQEGRRLPMEDFCQLAEKLPRDKYQSSYESCVKLLRSFSDEWIADGAELLRVVLFSWWVGNNDLHLKNLSLLAEDGRYRLSPCYDLLSTAIVGLDDRLALTIGGQHTKVRSGDWIELGGRAGLSPRAMEREVLRMLKGLEKALSLLERVPMRADLVANFLAHLRERIGPLADLWQAVVAMDERPTKAMTRPLVPTGEAALEVVQTIRAEFQDTGLPTESALHQELSELEWLARHPGPIFASDGPYASDPERTTRAFLRLSRLRWVARVLKNTSDLLGADLVRKRLRGLSTGPEGSTSGQSGDFLFELEVAAALQVTGHLSMQLGETDIEIQGPSGQTFRIECKRPRKRKNIAGKLREGQTQLARRGRAGFVVIGLTDLLPTKSLVADSAAAGLEDARATLAALLGPHDRALRGVFEPSPDLASLAPGTVFGAIFLADMLVATRVPASGGFLVRPHTVCRVMVNPHHTELGPSLVEFIAHSIVVGSDGLQR